MTYYLLFACSFLFITLVLRNASRRWAGGTCLNRLLVRGIAEWLREDLSLIATAADKKIILVATPSSFITCSPRH